MAGDRKVRARVAGGTACRALLTGLILLSVVSTLGCRRTLFRDRDDRTPYARYDRLRGEAIPVYRFDEFGRRVPNLRARLVRPEP